MPVNKAGRLGAFYHVPIVSGFARGLRALGAMSVLSRWSRSRQTGCSPFASSWGPEAVWSLDWAGLDLL